jgi:glycosyltransferase involved in cell wall biosynthesis
VGLEGLLISEKDSSGGNPEAKETRSCNRVLLCSPQPFYEDRGTPIAVRQVLLGLASLGYEVDVVTYPIGREVQIEGVRVFRGANPLKIRSVPIGFSLRKIVLDLGMIPMIYERLRKHKYVCIHAVEEAAFPAVIFGRLFGLPFIYDMQSSLPEQLLHYRVFRWAWMQRLFNRCEEWLLTNADWVMSSTGLSNRIRSIRPTAPFREWSFFSDYRQDFLPEVEELRAMLQIPEGSPVVVYAGTFEDYQGLPTLLAGIPAVLSKVPNAVFVLVGDSGSKGASFYRQARKMGVENSLRVISRQERERIPAFLALADVLFSPRLYGGNLPLKIFEYLASGKPIVATDIPAHRSVLNEKRAVLVAPEPHAFADAIVWVLQNPLEATALAEAARGYVTEQFGWKQFLYELEQVYSMVEFPFGKDAACANVAVSPGAPVSTLKDSRRCGPRRR